MLTVVLRESVEYGSVGYASVEYGKSIKNDGFGIMKLR